MSTRVLISPSPGGLLTRDLKITKAEGRRLAQVPARFGPPAHGLSRRFVSGDATGAPAVRHCARRTVGLHRPPRCTPTRPALDLHAINRSRRSQVSDDRSVGIDASIMRFPDRSTMPTRPLSAWRGRHHWLRGASALVTNSGAEGNQVRWGFHPEFVLDRRDVGVATAPCLDDIALC